MGEIIRGSTAVCSITTASSISKATWLDGPDGEAL